MKDLQLRLAVGQRDGWAKPDSHDLRCRPGRLGVVPSRTGLLLVAAGLFALLAACSEDQDKLVTAPIGPQGGVLSLPDGASIEVPQGALADIYEISIERTSEPIPSGIEGKSAVYAFRPHGLSFLSPASVSLPFSGTADGAAIYWSSREEGGFEKLGGTASGQTIRVAVDHFSRAFVGGAAGSEQTLKVISQNCGRGPGVSGVASLRLRVFDGSNVRLSEREVPADTSEIRLAGLAPGLELRAEVAGLDGGGAPVAYGTARFHSETTPTVVPLFLRPVERFSPLVSADDANLCTSLSVPRAGHTATLLDDGRVLIAGGFQGANRTPASWTHLASVEIFDPATGRVTTELPEMVFTSGAGTTPRAFHTATKLPSGQVLISGGEATTGAGATAMMYTVNNSILFDPTVADAPWAPIVTMKKWRSRHTATLEQNGRVLLFGGIDWGSDNQANFVDTFEWFDPEINRFRVPAENSPYTRIGHAALPFSNGQFMAIVAGAAFPPDKTSPELASGGDSVSFFKYKTETDKIQALSSGDIRLDPLRTHAAVASIGTIQFLVLGGFKSFAPAQHWDLFPGEPHEASDVITFKPVMRDAGPPVDLPRGHICAVTLHDGRVLAIGGRGQPEPATNPARMEALPTNTAFIEAEGNIRSVRAEPMLESRFFHTCTLLTDGSVLVTGGMSEKGTTVSTLSTMEIFVPRPAD